MIAGVGLASISFGVPVYLLYAMHKAMTAKMQEVRSEQKKRGTLFMMYSSIDVSRVCMQGYIHGLISSLVCVPVVAWNEFGQQFDYVAGNYRAEAWFVEPLDLFKKLLLSGAIMFIKPGSILQCNIAILISCFFTLAHGIVWPYPHIGANILKLITELQVSCLLSSA